MDHGGTDPLDQPAGDRAALGPPRVLGLGLIHEAANDAISDGTEKITRKNLHAVILDTAAQEQYHIPASRRPAASRRTRP